MFIVLKISLESLPSCLAVFTFLAAFLFRTEHFYHFAKLLAHPADGNDWFYVCPPQWLAQCPSWCTLVFCPLPTPEHANGCFRQWGHNSVSVVILKMGLTQSVLMLLRWRHRDLLVLQAIGVEIMIMRDYLERMWNTMNTPMSFGPSGQCCFNHDYHRLIWMIPDSNEYRDHLVLPACPSPEPSTAGSKVEAPHLLAHQVHQVHQIHKWSTIRRTLS